MMGAPIRVSAQQAAAVASNAPETAARTAQIVAAAEAFLGTLSAQQKKAVMFSFTDAEQRRRWSNFPDGTFPRAGVRWGQMNETQRTALFTLLGTVLSPTGVKMMREQLEAEEILKNTPPPAQRRALFGTDYYYVALLGTPSTTSPWMLQFTGHHLGLNATIVGPRLTISPSMTGGEPLKFMGKDGKPVYIVAEEVTAATALLNSLSAEQRNKAIISSRAIELVLGPGHDGKVLQPEGIPASELSATQKTQLLSLIEARLGIMNADSYAMTMEPIRSNLDATYFAWYGPTDVPGTAYFRVTGPTLLLEFAPQRADAKFKDLTQHVHNMYRDATNEYGSAWTALQ